MPASTNNTTIYTIKTRNGDIEAKLAREEEYITIVLSYTDLVNIIENAKKNNWA